MAKISGTKSVPIASRDKKFIITKQKPIIHNIKKKKTKLGIISNDCANKSCIKKEGKLY